MRTRVTEGCMRTRAHRAWSRIADSRRLILLLPQMSPEIDVN